MANTEGKRKTKKTATADTSRETPHPKRNTYGNRPSLAEACPELIREWNYERNDKTPWEITAGSKYKAHWICPDEECGHYKYPATVLNRTINGGGCPIKAGKAVAVGYNDLATICPELVEEWDYEANAKSGYTPYNITAGNNYKAHWICPDEACGHYKYTAQVCNRTKEKPTGCPAKAGKAVVVGYNDLATICPELVEEWDYEANAKSGYTPYNITAGNNYKAHWICPDEACGHYKYIARINQRSGRKSGCPAKAGKIVIVGYNDLATTYESLAKEWDYEANAKSGYTPYNITAGNNYKAHWICPDEACRHYKYIARVSQRSGQKSDCPVKMGRAVVIGYNDLATTYESLAKEWDYEANAESGYTPYNITAGNNYKAHWICPDEACGHYKYTAIVYNRTKEKPTDCPAKAGKAVVVGYNDLATICPELVEEWDYEANAKSGYTPYNITAGNDYKAHWICPDEACGHYKYIARINKRSGQKNGCPAKAGKIVIVGYNDLATICPELVEEWDYEANAKSGYTPYNITAGNDYKAHWICPDEACGHYKYIARINKRSGQKNGCPAKAGKAVVVGYNDLATICPELVEEWDYEANAKSGYTPYNITAGNDYKAHWICPDEACGHYKYIARINKRSGQKSGCPACSKTGFRINAKGYLYFISGTYLEKIGITNCLVNRLRSHKSFAPILLDAWTGQGDAVYAAEQMILRMINDPASGIDVCSKHGEKFDGCKETWSLSDITPNPKNLPELINILSKLNLSVDSVDLEALGLRRLTKEETIKELSS